MKWSFGLNKKESHVAASEIANCHKCSFGMSRIKVYNKGTDHEYWSFRDPELCMHHHILYIYNRR